MPERNMRGRRVGVVITAGVALLALQSSVFAQTTRNASSSAAQNATALVLLREAAALFNRHGVPQGPSRTFEGPQFDLVMGLARAGDIDTAIPFLPKLDDEGQSRRSLIVGYLADAGNFAAARDILSTLSDPSDQANTNARLARALYRANHRDDADAFLGKASSIVGQLVDGLAYQPLTEIALARLASGDRPAAERDLATAEAIARRTIAGSTDEDSPNIPDAETDSLLIPRREPDGALQTIIDVLADEWPNAAERLVGKLTKPKNRDSARATLVLAYLDHHDPASAKRAADLIDAPAVKATALKRITVAQVKAGDRAAATRTAAEIDKMVSSVRADEGGETPTITCLRAAEAHAITGDVTAANAAVAKIAIAADREWARMSAAILFARGGDFDASRHAISSVSAPAGRVCALAMTAQCLADAGDRSHAREFLDAAARAAAAAGFHDDTPDHNAIRSLAIAYASLDETAAARETLRAAFPDPLDFARHLARTGFVRTSRLDAP